MSSIYQELQKAYTSGRKAALCIITDTKGSTPRKIGAKMIVYATGDIFGTIGGGTLEHKVIEDALIVIDKNEAENFTHALVQDHQMCCGGSLDIYIEPIAMKSNLYIFGAGHIGKHLAHFASLCEFDVTVIDERKEMFSDDLLKGVAHKNMHHMAAIEELSFNAQTYICVVSHDHVFDREIVVACAKKQHAYLGMIGSQRKVVMAKKIFKEGALLTESEMSSIDWPMGIEMQSETPQEIAVAILAKLINVRAFARQQ